jgi:hypothetical protein
VLMINLIYSALYTGDRSCDLISLSDGFIPSHANCGLILNLQIGRRKNIFNMLFLPYRFFTVILQSSTSMQYIYHKSECDQHVNNKSSPVSSTSLPW